MATPTSYVASAVVAAVTPLASAPPEYNSEPAWRLPGWAEPVIVTSILFFACFYTRRKYYSVFSTKASYKSLLDTQSYEFSPTSSRSSSSGDSSPSREGPWSSDGEDESTGFSTSKNLPKQRNCCGVMILTPNSSKFAENWHSRVLYKFPFLMEMFYWILTYAIYRASHILSQEMFSDDIWETAQANGLSVLAAEQFTPLRFLLPIQEITVQKWFMNGHEGILTFLNKAYALIHIPGSVFFIAWYYYSAPTHSIFATVRRTVTLCNFLAFTVFALFPCMPPRLLPKEYGFIDTVRRDDAQSVWMSGKFVNHLAAMPSMHFGWSFMIGCTLIYHSGVLGCVGLSYGGRKGKSVQMVGKWWNVWYCALGIAYPTMILVTIIATANHYWLDAIAGGLVAAVALLCNRVFLVLMPLEDLLLWVLRIEKPKPNCGTNRR
ncbi:PAP2 superfamily-domain-containing protein [Morchella snyderi]|nr:PAP2 superfamily-domain-containing protein [Morchella snyderi]